MCELWFEQHQPDGLIVVGDVCPRGGTDVYSPKVATIVLFDFEALFDLFEDAIFVELSGAVLGEAGDARLG